MTGCSQLAASGVWWEARLSVALVVAPRAGAAMGDQERRKWTDYVGRFIDGGQK